MTGSAHKQCLLREHTFAAPAVVGVAVGIVLSLSG